MAARAGAAILELCQLSDFIAIDEQHFVQVAAETANNINSLQNHRKSLPKSLIKSPIGQVKLWNGAVYGSLEQLWQNWCETQRQNNPEPNKTQFI